MTIKDSVWQTYIKRLRRVSSEAASQMSKYLATTEWFLNNRTKQAAINYAYALATKYGEAATALACDMYDSVVAASAAKIAGAAEPARTATYAEVARAINGTAKTGNEDLMASSVDRMVKMAGMDTTMQNAIRDGAEWAWIPSGDSCAFCLELASNGWQRASRAVLNGDHCDHIHANCDCTFAIRFDSDSGVQGYNPSTYKRIYANAEGSNSKEKLNSIRRDLYAQNKDEINAQKREAYAKRQEREEEAED